MEVEITKAQIQAIVNLANDCETMIGCADDREDGTNSDKEWIHYIKMIDRFLIKNGFNR